MPSGSSSSSDLALNKARALLSKAHAAPAKSPARRAFFEHLITLSSARSIECKEYFGRHIGDFFSELEDLQDKAVDAVLDLCEDDLEKARIIGIKGLGTTARADARWVFLLGTLNKAPNELYYVKEVLRVLLDISPGEVFAVMADDCRGSEEETGASRRIIMDYLEKDLKDVREKVLQSGTHLEAERAFREGFLGVVKVAPPEESRLALSLLLPLSTVSGTHKSASTTTGFAHAVISAESSGAVFAIFDALWTRNPPIDPRLLYLFFAKHGTRLISAAVRERDRTAMGLVEELRSLMDSAMTEFKVGPRDGELAVETLGRRFCRKALQSLLDTLDGMGKKRIKVDPSIELVEVLLYSIYRILLIRDFRRDLIDREYRDDLDRLVEDSRYAMKKLKEGSKEEVAWRNVRDISEMLEEPKNRLRNITPSWRQSSSSQPQVLPPATWDRIRDAPPHQKQPPKDPALSKQLAVVHAPTEPTKATTVAPAAPSGPRNGVRDIAAPPSVTPADNGVSLLQRLGAPSISPSTGVKPIEPVKAALAAPRPAATLQRNENGNFAGKELLGSSKNAARDGDDNFAGRELIPRLAAASAATATAEKAQTAVPRPVAENNSIGARHGEANADANEKPRVTSLSIKRQREDDTVAPDPAPKKVSLLSRLGPKSDSDASLPASKGSSASAPLSSRFGQRTTATAPSAPELPRSNSGLSIRGQSQAPPPPMGLSILKRASSGTGKMLTHLKTPINEDMDVDDGPVNQKGRGFNRESNIVADMLIPKDQQYRGELPWQAGRRSSGGGASVTMGQH